jgi:hypothetical protein
MSDTQRNTKRRHREGIHTTNKLARSRSFVQGILSVQPFSLYARMLRDPPAPCRQFFEIVRWEDDLVRSHQATSVNLQRHGV